MDLVTAIYRSDFESIITLLRNGANINSVDQDGRTPLMHAVLSEKPDGKMVRFLVNRGATVNSHDKGQEWTALHFAARSQCAEIVLALLECGASVDAIDKFGNTPLWRCVMSPPCAMNVVTTLLGYGADPQRKNVHGVSPTDVAKNQGNEKLLQLLTSKKTTTE